MLIALSYTPVPNMQLLIVDTMMLDRCMNAQKRGKELSSTVACKSQDASPTAPRSFPCDWNRGIKEYDEPHLRDHHFDVLLLLVRTLDLVYVIFKDQIAISNFGSWVPASSMRR